MRRALPALLVVAVLSLAGCGGDSDADAARTPTQKAEPSAYSEQVRGNFLDSCLENATNTANGAATEEQLTTTCECILGKVEQEYSEAEFAESERRLLGGTASEGESNRLISWSTACAQGATR